MGVLTKKTKLSHSAAALSLFCVQMLWANPKEINDPNSKITSFKYPVPWLKLGADPRVRIDYDEARKLDRKATGHDRINTRYRGRVSAKIKQSENLDFNIRLATEPRYYHRPSSMDEQLVRYEALFDIMNFTWRNVFNTPMVTTVGWQDLGPLKSGARKHISLYVTKTRNGGERCETRDLYCSSKMTT